MKRRRRPVFSLLLILLPLTAFAQGGTAPLPAWRPDPALASRLGAEVTLDHCAFRPPVGCNLVSTESFASGRKLYTFAAKPHFVQGGTHLTVIGPTILITTETDGTAPPDWTVAQGVGDLLGGYADKMINGDFDKLTPPEVGSVGGLPALRRYALGNWDLDAREAQFAIGAQNQLHRVVPVRLLAYGIGDSHLGTLILAYDTERDSANTLPVLEASLLTLRHTDPTPAAAPNPTPAAAPDTSAPPGAWQPRADLLRFLGPEVVTHGLALRVPEGYQTVTMSVAGKPSASDPVLFGWQGPGQGLTPLLRVTATPLAADQPPPALTDVLAQLVAAEGQGLEKYAHTTPEVGVAGFGTTGRFTAAGNLRFAGAVAPKTVVVYVFLTRKYLITLEGISGAWNSAPEIDVMEAAILTGHAASPSN